MLLYAQDQFGYVERRDDRGNRQPPGPEHAAGRPKRWRTTRCCAASRAGKISRPGLHQRFLHAARRQRTLRIRPEETGASATRKPPQDGIFSLEEVECIGACTGAPAMQVNYDFYENLDPDQGTTQIFEQLRRRARKPQAFDAVISGSVHDRGIRPKCR